MESDIVERLGDRAEINESDPAMLPSESKILREAADEIQRLRAELSTANAALAEARRMLSEINDENERFRDELAAAIKQRDEARRMFCHEIAESGKLEHEYDENARLVAESFDWNCFKGKEGGES